MYKVTLKPGHPKGLYHRSGRAFTQEPVILSDKEMTDEIKNDPWLVVEKLKGKELKEAEKAAEAARDPEAQEKPSG